MAGEALGAFSSDAGTFFHAALAPAGGFVLCFSPGKTGRCGGTTGLSSLRTIEPDPKGACGEVEKETGVASLSKKERKVLAVAALQPVPGACRIQESPRVKIKRLADDSVRPPSPPTPRERGSLSPWPTWHRLVFKATGSSPIRRRAPALGVSRTRARNRTCTCNTRRQTRHR